jgi:hypothetical protein
MLDDSPVLLWLHPADASAPPQVPPSAVLEVRAVPLPAADGERAAFRAAVDHVVDAARPLVGRRWLVGAAESTAVELVGAVEEVLSGRAPVFGFAGAVLGSYESASPRLAEGVPSLALGVPGTAASDPAALDRFVAAATSGPAVPASWARLLASDRVDPAVRRVLARRALSDDPAYAPQVVDRGRLALLRELADVLVPQDGPAIDLAARVDAQYARGEGDGWRFADLPPDPEALRRGLQTLHPLWPDTSAQREELVATIVRGEADTAGPFDARELAAWLEDVRVDLVRQWLAHPASMAAVGYDGFATGGTVLPLRGFAAPASRREPWEPAGVVREEVA